MVFIIHLYKYLICWHIIIINLFCLTPALIAFSLLSSVGDLLFQGLHSRFLLSVLHHIISRRSFVHGSFLCFRFLVFIVRQFLAVLSASKISFSFWFLVFLSLVGQRLGVSLVMFYWFGCVCGFILHSIRFYVHVFRQWFQFVYYLFYLLCFYVNIYRE